MMSVIEYAKDVNLEVKVILELCTKLGLGEKNANSILSDDDIVTLDNEVAIMNTEDEAISQEDEIADIEDIIETTNEKQVNKGKPNHNNKNKKKNTKKDSNKKDNFKEQRKKMYKSKKKLQSNMAPDDETIIIYHDGMTVSKLAEALGANPIELIKKLMSLGLMANMNTSLDFDTASLMAIEYHKELKNETTRDEINFEELEVIDKEEDLVSRAPVITIMGHVDHGKTTLLDTIRKTNVASGEAGGITQAIGAYQIDYNGKKLTFIDTPGHAAFTEMRARGASITDIVIIIVAADDGVMPQTVEAIDHAKAAGVPIIVAVNKMDKPNANPDRVLTDIANYGLTPEIWGGDTMVVNISAVTGMGIDDLLERILLISELKELKANPKRYASGTVIESEVSKREGVVATLLIQNGTLRLGDAIVVGNSFGKVRTLKNDRGENLTQAGPSTPVSITGLNESPMAGDKFMVFENEKKARTIAEQRKIKTKENNNQGQGPITLDDLFSRINDGAKEINIILKADVNGSEEAVKNSLLKIDVEGVKINVIRSGVGAISEGDIVLAQASNAIIIGFNIRPNNKIINLAKEKNVEIRLHNIIYKVIEEMEAAMKGKLDPEFEENILGQAEVRKLFKFSKVGTIAGSYVTSGIIKRDAKSRVIRDDVVIYDGNINSLAREKDQVKEVKQGIECGITILNFNDIKEGDIIEAYEIVEIKR